MTAGLRPIITLVGDETAPGVDIGEPTTVHETAPAVAAALAYSDERATDDLANRYGWRPVWIRAAGVLAVAAAVAVAIVAVWTTQRVHPAPAPNRPTAIPAPVPMSPTASPKPSVDDDEYVAIALSPSAIGNSHHLSGYGTSGSQDEANRIALSECRAVSGNDDCLLANAGMHHGCVAYASDDSAHRWTSGSGADLAAARDDALRRLGVPESAAGVQCSNPPGIITAAPPQLAPTKSRLAAPAPKPGR